LVLSRNKFPEIMKKLTVFTLLVLVIVSCQTKPNEELAEIKQTQEFDETTKVLTERFASMYETIPSSELAAYLESVDADYNGSFINDPGMASEYLISPEQSALALGVYFMDINYTAAYGKRDQTSALYDAMQMLADSIGMARVLNQAILEQFNKELEENQAAKTLVRDALIEGTKHLNTTNRPRLSTLIMAGIVIERLHLISSIIDQSVESENLYKQDLDLMITPLMRAAAQQADNVNKMIEAINLIRTPDDEAEGFALLYELQHEYSRLEEKKGEIDPTLSVDPTVFSGIFAVVKDLRQRIVTPGN